MMSKKVVISLVILAAVITLWPRSKNDVVEDAAGLAVSSASLLEPRQVRARLGARYGDPQEGPSELARKFKELVEASASSSAPSASETAQKAFALVGQAAKDNDKSILDEVAKLGADCAFCDQFYKRTREQLSSSELKSNERAIFASALVRSGGAANISQVVDMLKTAGEHAELQDPPSVYANALEDTTLAPEALDEISAGLNSENKYYREAIVSLLTKQGTKEAAQRLYDHVIEADIKDGYYNSGMGIGKMFPQPDAIPYLEELVAKRDKYSALAIDAILHTGRPGLDRVIALLSDSKDYESDKKLLRNSVDYIDRDAATLAYMQKLSKTGATQAIREMAKQVLAEKDIEIFNLEKENEYNSNFENYIIK